MNPDLVVRDEWATYFPRGVVMRGRVQRGNLDFTLLTFLARKLLVEHLFHLQMPKAQAAGNKNETEERKRRLEMEREEHTEEEKGRMRRGRVREQGRVTSLCHQAPLIGVLAQ